MTAVSWAELSDELKAQHYTKYVRFIFGSGNGLDEAGRNEVARRDLFPSLSRLETAQIEITTWCNLKCQQCSRTLLTNAGEWHNEHLALDKYVTMIDKLPPADFLVLQGVGEPTLHPNFNELVDTGLKSGKFAWVAFNTNGLARNDAFWIDLAKNKQCVVTLSIDSLDPAVAERCRAGTNAAQLFERLKLFRSLFPNFKISLVASKLNIDDIATTLERIAALGQGFAQIQEMISTQSELLLDKWDRARLTDDLAELRRKYPTFTVTTSSISSGLKKCVAPFVAPFITIDGFLAPCCAFVDARPYNFVSLLGDDDWDAVRSRPEVRAWQDGFLTEDPAPCKACSFNPARDAAATSPRGGRSFKTS